ncbi:hypothetical protein L210DRAFT_3408718 [Boletus edulis BED1]|uniref:FAS1 domain-containing protein n=1 Tax=Boletus edulis BED1 TaxID=1328754 RepID=A0AAD4BNV7_BOLED|nr:hypothetical protein L210DRAFT_3408718 [Boletus edulis BED1]
MVQEPPQDPVFIPVTTTRPSLTDLLTIQSSASIYFSYARETEFSKEFSVVDNQLTLLVPTNKAVMALSRKPHQGPAPDEPEVEMSEQQYDERSKRNVEHWVAAHIIPCRISLSDVPVTYNTLLDGKSVTFTPVSGGENLPDWSRVTLEGSVHIVEMKEGENGVIYMIDGTINPN